MKWSVNRDTLVSALQKVVGITEQKKTTMLVLSHVLLEATADNRLRLSATDLDISLRTSIDAQVEIPGQTAVPARKFLEGVKELKQERLHCDLSESHRLSITAGMVNYVLATIPAADFPYFETINPAETHVLDTATVRSALESTVYAVPQEEDALSIPGMFWHRTASDRVRFVSSDGHRLALKEIPFPAEAFFGRERGVVVPRKGVLEVIRLLEKADKASGALHENRLLLHTPDTYLSVHLLEEAFPQYELILPEGVSGGIEIPRAEFYAALRRMAVVTDASAMHVRFLISENLLGLEAGNVELGTAYEEIPVDYPGENFAVAFNIRYVMDVVQSFSGRTVRFEWVDGYRGGVFRDPEDSSVLALIMPMMV